MKHNNLSVERLLQAAARLFAFSTASAVAAAPAFAAETIHVTANIFFAGSELTGDTTFQFGDEHSYYASVGSLSGAGSLLVVGGANGGTLALTAANSYTGGTLVKDATLIVGGASTLGGAAGIYAGPVVIASEGGAAATLDFQQGAKIQLNGRVSGSGNFTVSGGGTVVLDSSANNFNGAFNVNWGTLQAGNDNALGAGATLNVGGAGTLSLRGYAQTAGALNLSGGTVNLGSDGALSTTSLSSAWGGTLNLASGGRFTTTLAADADNTFAGAIAGGSTSTFTKAGQGRLVLTGNNTEFTGTLTVTQGTLAATSDAALGGTTPNARGDVLALTLNGGTLELNSWGVFAKAITVGPAGGTLTTANEALFYSGKITGTGALTKTGAQRLELGDAASIEVPFLFTEGTLAGTGSIARPTFAAGTTLAPGAANGAAFGTLRLGNGTATPVTLAGIHYNVTLDGGAYSDNIAVHGDAIFGAGNTLQFTNTYGINQQYRILSATGKIYADAATLASTTLLWGTEPVDNSTRKKAFLKVVDAPLPEGAPEGTVPGRDLVLAMDASSSLRLTWNDQFPGGAKWEKGDQTLGETPKPNAWKDGATTGHWFQDGDIVEFGGETAHLKALDITPGGVVVGDMTVSGKGWVFNGGTITALTTLTHTPDPAFAPATTKLNVLADASATFNNTLHFPGGIHIAGDATFNGYVSTNTGATAAPLTIAAGGTLTLKDDAGLYAGAVGDIANDGTLVFDRGEGHDYWFNLPVTGAGSIEKRGAGRLTLTGENTTTGTLTVFGGRLAYATDSNLGTGENILDGGTIVPNPGTHSKPWTLGPGGGTFEIYGIVHFAPATIDVTNPETGETTSTPNPAGPFGGITGPGALTKTGTGNLHLDSGAHHEGNTTVLGGNLHINGTLGAGGNYTGTVTLDGGNLYLKNDTPQTLAGAILGATLKNAEGLPLTDENNLPLHPGGEFHKSGGGTLTLGGETPAQVTLKKFVNAEGKTIATGTLNADTLDNGTIASAVPGETTPATLEAPVINAGTLDNHAHGTVTATTVNLNVGTLAYPPAAALLNHANATFTADTVTIAAADPARVIENRGDYHAAITTGKLNNTATGSIHLDREAGRQNSIITHLANDGALYFNADAPGQKLTVQTLANLSPTGRGHIHNYHFDPASAASSDTLLITGELKGRHTLHLILPDTGIGAVKPNYTRDLFQYAATATIDPEATIEIADPIDSGIYRLGIKGKGNSTLRVVAYSPEGNSIILSTAALSIGWFSQLDNINSRLGELRIGLFTPETQREVRERPSRYEARRDHTAAADTEFGLWLRAYGNQTNADLKTPGLATFKEFQYGGDLGSDLVLTPDPANKLILGAFVGFQGARRNINDGSGSLNDTRSILGGTYLNWVNQSGWYAGLTLKGQYFLSEFRTGLDTMKSSYNSGGLGAGIEVGKQITLPDNWFIEPSLQLEYLHINGEDFSTKRTEYQDIHHINIESAGDLRFAASIRGGFNLDLQTHGVLQPYVRLGIEYQSASGGDITITNHARDHSDTVSPDISGYRVRGSLGLTWQATNSLALHAEYSAAYGDKTRTPYAITLGLRHRF